jgi:hypothetical protein
MVELARIEPKLHHCGRLARILRHEHMAACLGTGTSVHRQIRRSFVASYMVRGWTIDGDLGGLAGVTGTRLSPYAFVWFGISERAKRYPVYIVKEARAFMDEVLSDKLEVRTTVQAGDLTALRFAIHMGFGSAETPPAFGYHGRRLVLNCLRDNPDVRVPHEGGYAVPMVYAGEQM